MSSAVNDEIGKVDSNNSQNSITKEVAINYLKDNRIGIGISGTNVSGTTASIFTQNSHNLSGIVTFTISNAGTNYNAGVTTTLYNVPLYNNSATDTGDGATAHIAVGSGGTVASVKIIDSGSAYDVGDVLKIGDGSGRITISGINNAVGKVVQVVGVGVTSNRNDSSYNGLFKVTGITSCKTITYDAGNPGIYAGIGTLPQGMICS